MVDILISTYLPVFKIGFEIGFKLCYIYIYTAVAHIFYFFLKGVHIFFKNVSRIIGVNVKLILSYLTRLQVVIFFKFVHFKSTL